MEEVYVMHVCKNCKRAFIARDTSNCQDTPSTSKYCPRCVENGFRNRAPDREERWLVKLYDFYKEKGITDKDLKDVMKTLMLQYIRSNKSVKVSTIYNKARRILAWSI